MLCFSYAAAIPRDYCAALELIPLWIVVMASGSFLKNRVGSKIYLCNWSHNFI